MVIILDQRGLASRPIDLKIVPVHPLKDEHIGMVTANGWTAKGDAFLKLFGISRSIRGETDDHGNQLMTFAVGKMRELIDEADAVGLVIGLSPRLVGAHG